ncbi:MAG: DUF3313 family protein [Pseudomonadales bacterium]
MIRNLNDLLLSKRAILTTDSLMLVLVLTFVSYSGFLGAKEELPEVTHDGLHRLHKTKVALAYQKPEADFSIYHRVLILDCHVAFKKNWQKKQNRERRALSSRISDKDMERIKRDMADVFRDVFVEELDKVGGYQVVDTPANDVLLIRPVIIDLDVTAPDKMEAGRSRTFTSSAGAATLYLELYDSVSGEILARAIDRKAGRSYGHFQWSSRVRNSAEAKRIVRQWANLLRQRLDEMHGK